jgi:hypothetical protein
MSEFGAGDGIPFVAGSIRGHRVWSLRGGYLISPSQGMTWSSVEAVAQCEQSSNLAMRKNSFFKRQSLLKAAAHSVLPENCIFYNYDLNMSKKLVTLHWVTDSWFPFDRTATIELPEQTDLFHYEVVVEEVPQYIYGFGQAPADELMMLARGTLVVDYNRFTDIYEELKADQPEESHFPLCSCGFYAYYDYRTANRYASGNVVSGVVEGYGETVVGTEGFRSQKIKIVALTCSSEIENQIKSKGIDFSGVKFFKKESQMKKEFPVNAPEWPVS